jgi:hypothetical protein
MLSTHPSDRGFTLDLTPDNLLSTNPHSRNHSNRGHVRTSNLHTFNHPNVVTSSHTVGPGTPYSRTVRPCPWLTSLTRRSRLTPSDEACFYFHLGNSKTQDRKPPVKPIGNVALGLASITQHLPSSSSVCPFKSQMQDSHLHNIAERTS